jgi:N-acetylneuraminate synthase/N,N'-diacetyllegionaminate synthase
MFKKNKIKKPILVAELCQNHRGSISLLKEMIIAAKEAGIKYLKIQDINSNELVHRKKFDNKNTKNLFRPFSHEYKRLKKLDLPKNFINIFIEECKKNKLNPLVTPFSHKSYSRIKNKDFYAIKIASYDSTSYAMLKNLKRLELPFIISTGATNNSQIIKTSKFMKDQIYALLHCVTVYPTPLHLCNLSKIKFLNQFTPYVGWSDHTEFDKNGHIASLASILFGGKIIERHFTILKRSETKDGIVSINPENAKEFIKLSKLKNRDIKLYLKDINKNWMSCASSNTRKLSKVEMLNLDYYRGRFATKLKNKVVNNWQDYKI